MMKAMVENKQLRKQLITGRDYKMDARLKTSPLNARIQWGTR
jgi:hypothetical protein